MKGFHPTPRELVDRMVDQLFQQRRPTASDRVLDPGCGQGAFIDGVIRWCEQHGAALPTIVGVESDPSFVSLLRRKYADNDRVIIENADFLQFSNGKFDYVVGNPPYVPITGLTEAEKADYRARFSVARGRFDLYFLFFEQALRSMLPNSRLVFVTPEKFTYVDSAQELRKLLHRFAVRRIEMVREDAFPGLITYPTVTTVDAKRSARLTAVIQRNGLQTAFSVPPSGESWLPLYAGSSTSGSATLEDICSRISAGIATGADQVFVHAQPEIPSSFRSMTYPTIAGRDIRPGGTVTRTDKVMIVPYAMDGTLRPSRELGPALTFLGAKHRRRRLLQRTCVTRERSPKLWYAFHETPRLQEILRPKILSKDISPRPVFVADSEGTLLPQHSVYYIVPHSPEMLEPLLAYLRSSDCEQWLRNNCQRAANGFLRVQSRVLKKLPIPDELWRHAQELVEADVGSMFAGTAAT